MAKLSPKQERFVEEYLVDLNATQAAIRAGYSAKTAKSQGQRLLTKADVQAEMQKARRKQQERTNITADRVLAELAAVGFARATDYATVANQEVILTDTAGLTDRQVAAIASVRRGRNGVEVRMHDKLRALELLGRHLGMFDGESQDNSISITLSEDMEDWAQ